MAPSGSSSGFSSIAVPELLELARDALDRRGDLGIVVDDGSSAARGAA